MTDTTPMTNGLDKSHSSVGSPWKTKNDTSENLELQAKVMATPNATHSSYVPGQLERHLEFMNFNSGMSRKNRPVGV